MKKAKKIKGLPILFLFLGAALMLPEGGIAAPLPKATQKMLKEYKLDPSALSDIDQELKVPKEWIEKAKKEGTLKVRGTPATARELRVLFAPFKERYPYINPEYFGANRQSRTIKTLMADRKSVV